MKQILSIFLLIAIAGLACKKESQKSPVEETKASMIGNWKALSTKVNYYDSSGKLLDTQFDDRSAGTFKFDETGNYRVVTPSGSEQPGTYILTSLSGEIYIVLTGRLAPPEGETIKLSDIRKTSMEWIHEGTNGGEFLVDGKWAKATKVIITLTFVKV